MNISSIWLINYYIYLIKIDYRIELNWITCMSPVLISNFILGTKLKEIKSFYIPYWC